MDFADTATLAFEFWRRMAAFVRDPAVVDGSRLVVELYMTTRQRPMRAPAPLAMSAAVQMIFCRNRGGAYALRSGVERYACPEQGHHLPSHLMPCAHAFLSFDARASAEADAHSAPHGPRRFCHHMHYHAV